MSNATSFGRQASTYAKGRPGYPPELYDWIAENSPGTETVWDIGTGNGQAATALADRFSQVHATDISAEQIAATKPHAKINYVVAPAQASGLPQNWADSLTVATAVHWFAETEFWSEVSRVGKPGALFCAWTYQLPRSTDVIERDFLNPLLDLIDPYWAEGNRICMRGYSPEDLNCPFQVLSTPSFDAGAMWTAEQLKDFVQSWSAHLRAREDGHSEALKDLSDKLMKDHAGQDIQISLPLSLLAARIK